MDNFENGTNNNENQEEQLNNENIIEDVNEQQNIKDVLEESPEEQTIISPATHETSKPKRETYKRHAGLSYLAMGLIGSLIGGFITVAIAPTYLYGKVLPYPQNSGSNTQLGQQIVIKTQDNITTATAVAQKVTPAVVGISTITSEADMFGFVRPTEGVGSGFVVNPNGYIVTNAHVVGTNPSELTVYFKDGKEMPGKVLWKDTTLDMAVVKVEAKNLPYVELGDSDTIQVGETAVAIGNPLGLRYERTVTQGIISGLNRSIRVSEVDIMEDLIQTDAAINPGNSGGPLINSQGKIIGINTAKASAEGLGFAIPINIAKPIIKGLIDEGDFNATYIGIGLLDKEIAGYLDTNIEIEKGIYITSVLQGLPADKAGLKAQDLITHINGTEVNTMIKFKTMLYNYKPGDTIKVKYLRDNKTYEANITLMAKPEE